MAAPALNVCRQALRASHRTQWLSIRQCQATIQPQSRTFCNTPLMRDEKDSTTTKAKEDDTAYFNDDLYKSLYSAAKDVYLQSSPSERRELEDLHHKMEEELGPQSSVGRDMDALVEREVFDARSQMPLNVLEKPNRGKRPPSDFSGMGEPDRDIAPDEVFRDDDITSLAHAQLDVHRELREYSRLAAWEMPLLSTLITPFSAPTSASPLRWRYTTYLGTPHPAANKVVLTFRPTDLGLTPPQVSKLIKLSGVRYDPHSKTVKMSAESFPSQAQNKRFLGSQIADLIAEAKDGKDTLEDVPFDFRHARRKPRAKFPRTWALTEERRQALEAKWQATEREKIEGRRLIEEAKSREQVAAVAAPVTQGRKR